MAVAKNSDHCVPSQIPESGPPVKSQNVLFCIEQAFQWIWCKGSMSYTVSLKPDYHCSKWGVGPNEQTHPDGGIRWRQPCKRNIGVCGNWGVTQFAVRAVVKWNILLESHEGQLASPDSHKEVELCSAGNGKWASFLSNPILIWPRSPGITSNRYQNNNGKEKMEAIDFAGVEKTGLGNLLYADFEKNFKWAKCLLSVHHYAKYHTTSESMRVINSM